MIIHRVTATVKHDQLDDMVKLMQTGGRALFQISRICTKVPEDDGEEASEHGGAVIFDIDFPDLDALAQWRANVGAPDNKDFFQTWGSMVVEYGAQDLVMYD